MKLSFCMAISVFLLINNISLAQEGSASSGNIFLDPSFEKGALTKKTYSPQLFVCPVGNVIWDNGGTKAHTGNAALGISNENYFVASTPVTAGKRYRLSAWFRSDSGEQPTHLHINWMRSESASSPRLIKFDIVTPKCTTEYRSVELAATAPDEAVSANLFFMGPKETIWIDDVSFSEATDTD